MTSPAVSRFVRITFIVCGLTKLLRASWAPDGPGAAPNALKAAYRSSRGLGSGGREATWLQKKRPPEKFRGPYPLSN